MYIKTNEISSSVMNSYAHDPLPYTVCVMISLVIFSLRETKFFPPSRMCARRNYRGPRCRSHSVFPIFFLLNFLISSRL